MTRTLFACGAIAASLCALVPAIAQDPPEPEPITWPTLDSKQQQRLTFLLRKLDDEDPEVRAESETGLIELGAGIAPQLWARLGRDEDQAPVLARLLDTVVTPEYGPLVADRIDDRSIAVRRWCVAWLAQRHDQGYLPAMREKLGDKDAEIRFHAGLGVAGLGDLDGMPPVLAGCIEDWQSRAAATATALTPARGAKLADWLLDKMREDDERTQITALRLLRYLGPKTYAARVAIHLDAQRAQVKKEAINALRVIVDGDEPLETLAVFQAIEQAKQWKARLK
jgi:hypothetical protein